MARYKDYDYDQMKMIPVAFDRQILPGSFEYSLAYLIDHELDLARFDQHYRNDDNGRPPYDPRLLLKIIILAYSKHKKQKTRHPTFIDKSLINGRLSSRTKVLQGGSHDPCKARTDRARIHSLLSLHQPLCAQGFSVR